MAKKKSKKDSVKEIEEMCKEMLHSASDSEREIILKQLDLCNKQKHLTPSGHTPPQQGQ